MKKYEPNKPMDCPKCGHKGQPRVIYENIAIDIEYITVKCIKCGYEEDTLPLDDNGKRNNNTS